MKKEVIILYSVAIALLYPVGIHFGFAAALFVLIATIETEDILFS